MFLFQILFGFTHVRSAFVSMFLGRPACEWVLELLVCMKHNRDPGYNYDGGGNLGYIIVFASRILIIIHRFFLTKLLKAAFP